MGMTPSADVAHEDRSFELLQLFRIEDELLKTLTHHLERVDIRDHVKHYFNSNDGYYGSGWFAVVARNGVTAISGVGFDDCGGIAAPQVDLPETPDEAIKSAKYWWDERSDEELRGRWREKERRQRLAEDDRRAEWLLKQRWV